MEKDNFVRVAWYTVTDCLGPGKRFAVWVQGCAQRCPGCIAEPLQDMEGGTPVSAGELAEKFLQSGADGITLSGGEPFLQSEKLALFLKKVRKERPETGVIIYTGLNYEELAGSELLQYADLLIDGAYVEALDDGKPMRGSSNQRLIFLTDRYDESGLPHRRKNKVVFAEDGFRVIGIPSDGARKTIDALKMKGDRNGG